MDDLISRQYLLNIARSEGAYDYVSTYEILHAPSVKFEQKKGIWQESNVPERFGITHRCSNCGYGTRSNELHSYCPNCGAEMEVENDS